MVDFNRLISEIEEDKAFMLEGGEKIRSLSSLAEKLKSMEPTEFSHHVNNEKNDFASWISGCFEDELLSTRISQLQTKEEMAKELETRIGQAKVSLSQTQQQQAPQQEQHPVQEQAKEEPPQQVEPQPTQSTTQETPEEHPPTEQQEKQPEPAEQPQEPTPTQEEPQEQAPVEQPQPIESTPQETPSSQQPAEQPEPQPPQQPTEQQPTTQPEPAIQPQEPTSTQTPQPQQPPAEPPAQPQPQAEPQPDVDTSSDLDDSLDDELDEGIDTDLDGGIDEGLDVGDKEKIDEKKELEKKELLGKLDKVESKEEVQPPQREQPQEAPSQQPVQPPAEPQAKEEPQQPIQEQPAPEAPQLIDAEKRLLKTDNKQLSAKEIFDKFKLQKKIGTLEPLKELQPIKSIQEEAPAEQQAKEEAKPPVQEETQVEKPTLEQPLAEQQGKEQPEQAPTEELDKEREEAIAQLTEEDQNLLKTDIGKLNAKEKFRKFKLQKELEKGTGKAETLTEAKKEGTAEEKKDIGQPTEKPVDLLNISDEEFNRLIGVNPEEEFIGTVSTEDIIEIKKRECLKTGVPGFDELLQEGIPKGSTVLISGGPGSGKTTFCIQQLGWAAEHGEKCLFISLEEKEERLIEHLKGYSLNPEKYIKNGTLRIKKLDSFKLSRAVEALLAKARGELMIDVNPIMDIIPEGYKPDRIVLDSLSAVAAAFAGQPEVYRIYVEQLFSIFGDLGTTSFIITEIHGSESTGHGGVEDFLADGVINFYNIKKGTVRQPAVEVLKMRGINHKRKIVPFNFVSGKGIEVYPLEEVFHGD